MNRALVAVLALALVLRVAAVAGQPDLQPAFDAGDYERHALSIAAGDGYPDTAVAAPGSPTALRPPLYPYVLGAVYAVSGDSRTAARLLGAVLGTLAVLLLFLIGRAVFSERAGLWAAALAAVSPTLVLLNSSLVSEQVFVPLVLGLALAIVRAPRGDWRWAALLGVLCGLAALTRVIGLLLVLPAVLAVWGSRPRLTRRALLAPVAVVLAAALTVLPWSLRNTAEFDRFVPLATQEGFNLFSTYNAEVAAVEDPRASWRFPLVIEESKRLFHRRGIDEAEISEELGARARRYILDHPLYPLEVAALNTPRLFGIGDDAALARTDAEQTGIPDRLRGVVDVSVYLTLASGLAGIALLVRRRASVVPLSLWLIPGLLFLGAVFFLAVPRYRVPLDPFLLLLAAGGLTASPRSRR